MKKYRLIQGELARISRGNATPIFVERGKEIYYSEDVALAVAELLDKIVDEFMFDGSEKLMLGRIASEVFGCEKPTKEEENDGD